MVEERPSIAVSSAEQRLGEAVARVYRVLVRGFEKYMGMPVPQYRILLALSQGDESQATLCKGLEIDKAMVTRYVKRLEADGLVLRRTDPVDNRFTLVTLTDRGQELLVCLTEKTLAFEARLQRELTADEAASTLRCLKHIHTAAQDLQMTCLQDPVR